MDQNEHINSNLIAARPNHLPSLAHKGQRILQQATPALLVLVFGALACQAQSLEGITTVTTNFLTWFRPFLGIVCVIAIVSANGSCARYGQSVWTSSFPFRRTTFGTRSRVDFTLQPRPTTSEPGPRHSRAVGARSVAKREPSSAS